jgi:hypothetical protein
MSAGDLQFRPPSEGHVCWSVSFTVASILVLAGCARGGDSASGTSSTVATPAVPAAPTAAAPLDSIGRLFADLDARIRPLVASRDSALAGIRADSGTGRADSSFALFRGQFALRAESVSTAIYQNQPLQHWIWRVTAEGWTDLDSASADSLRRFLAVRGLRAEFSEGSAYAAENTAAMGPLFERYLSPAMRSFLSIRRAEEDEGYSEDAGLRISWDQLAERIAGWERFVDANPGFLLAGEGRYRYDSYLAVYLTGMDNSRVFEYPRETLDPRVRASYERFLTRHAESGTARIVRGYLDVLGRNGWRAEPDVVAFLKANGIHSMLGQEPPTR